jgi:translation initiation factor 1 (eIF-1/SUI1)
VRFYGINYDKSEEEHENATIDEIMDFDDMPTKTYTEIVTETRDRAEKYFDKMKKVDNEIKELKDLTQKVKSACATQDMIQQATELLRVMENERRKLEWDYRYFYHRLDALNLINHDTSDNNA